MEDQTLLSILLGVNSFLLFVGLIISLFFFIKLKKIRLIMMLNILLFSCLFVLQISKMIDSELVNSAIIIKPINALVTTTLLGNLILLGLRYVPYNR